jgi:hypothetical protein
MRSLFPVTSARNLAGLLLLVAAALLPHQRAAAQASGYFPLPYADNTSDPGPVFEMDNYGSGPGLVGTSQSGTGGMMINGAGSGLNPLYGWGGGVWGDSDNGWGVIGLSGTGGGVYAKGHEGVHAECTYPGNSAVLGVNGVGGNGVSGINSTTVGAGVYGQSAGGSGMRLAGNYVGVWGDSSDIGVYGTGLIFGAFGEGDVTGVNGRSIAGTGVFGEGDYGVEGASLNLDGRYATALR